MTSSPTPLEIRDLRAAQPQMRERDFARIHKLSEAQLVAAYVGAGVTRLRVDVPALLEGARTLGPVMALTRNESAVHEKIGPYEKVFTGGHNAMVLGEQIDLRIFPSRWACGFAVTKQTDEGARHSLQFFDAAGDAVHKIHLRPESNLAAYHTLVGALISEDQSQSQPIGVAPSIEAFDASKPQADAQALRQAWGQLTDTHQFFPMLRDLNLKRHQAVLMAGPDYVQPVAVEAVEAMFERVVANGLPLMAFVGNAGCIQIHSGPIHKTARMGAWFNVMDETFHMHLRIDHIAHVYVVRKPVTEGHVTSLEAYDAQGRLIIQFFGKRIEGHDERPLWRETLADLPQPDASVAA